MEQLTSYAANLLQVQQGAYFGQAQGGFEKYS